MRKKQSESTLDTRTFVCSELTVCVCMFVGVCVCVCVHVFCLLVCLFFREVGVGDVKI